MQTQEGIARVLAAKEALELAENVSGKLLDAIYSDIASRTVTVAKAWHDRRDTIKEAVQKRRDAFEEFARAVCGAPPLEG